MEGHTGPKEAIQCPQCRNSYPGGTSVCPHCGTCSISSTGEDETVVLESPATGFTENDETVVSDVAGSRLSYGEAAAGETPTRNWSRPAAARQDAVQALGPGVVINNRYEILRLLGEGGMGAVFKVRDRELDRLVALKVIRPDMANNPRILRMFKQELILARQVTHQNVIRIYDLGLAGDLRFITMQFVQGSDLRSLLDEKGKFSSEEAASIMVQVCEGLAAAHQQSVVHRDLKPNNVMIDDQGNVLVMDFGLAHSTDAGGSEGALLGTPQYMSPEQANREEIDSRSDLYALGVIFYELLTGRLPFDANGLKELLDKRIHSDAPPPIEREPSIAQALNEIVVKCLVRSREQRYQTAAEIIHDIQVWQGVIVPPSKVWKRVAMGSAVLLALMGGVGVKMYVQRPLPPPKTVTVLVADFKNQTGDHVLDGTLEPLFTEAMEGASFISAYSRPAAHRLAGQVKPGATALDSDVARLVALREGVNVVLSGSIEKAGGVYKASVKAVDAATGNAVAEARVKESTKEKLAASVSALAEPIRKALGDRTPAARSIEAGETFTAASLQAAQEYSIAQETGSSGKWEEAIQHYREALQLDPNNGRAWSGLGVCYRNLQNLSEAEKDLKIALSKSGQMSERERYRTRGAYYVTINNYEKALDEYKILIAKFPADNVALANVAICYTYLRNIPKVIETLQKAVAIFPKDARFRMNLTEGYLYGGKFDDAAREAGEVLKLNPSFERAYAAKAVAALATGKPEQAAEFYEQAGKVGQRYRTIGLADLALFEGRPTDASSLLEAGIKADVAGGHTSWAVLKEVALANARLQLGQKAAAIAAAKQALKETPDQTVMFLAARMLVEAGDEATAQSVAQNLSRQLYSEPGAYGKLLEGELALKKGDIRGAIKLMMDARGLVDTWIGHYDLGRAYLAAEAWPEADSEFDACINRRGEAVALDLNLDPTYSYYPPVLFYSGRAKEGIGSPAAVEAFKSFLSIKGKAEHDPLVGEAKRRAAK